MPGLGGTPFTANSNNSSMSSSNAGGLGSAVGGNGFTETKFGTGSGYASKPGIGSKPMMGSNSSTNKLASSSGGSGY